MMPLTNAEIRARYRARHLEKVRAADRNAQARKRVERPSETRQAKRKWVVANPEKVREQRRRTRKRHPGTGSAAAWKAAHPERARELGRRSSREYRARRRARLTDPADIQAMRDALVEDPCSYCGGDGEQDDHIVALNAGGAHSADNLTRACRSCNSRKRDMPLLVFMVRRFA